ncbi:hypothetical protein [Tenacibaculum caenipelagi]|uniref:Uncharacterized protein n=1 Tax=Tenacibaculum caenipelagi TaxID=1325435 RepID=A0A4R6TCS7_9FLAO|nr:hypothetical protein [Tenacibaculum caenipelagi]TDQ27615.1 hypothetical protein DFQ07_1466 [Tenacibaculum caenipelagi]
MNKYINEVKSDKQMKYLQSVINKYKEVVIKTAYNYAKKHFYQPPTPFQL